jgi:arabinose-5-phosphate isomerase
MARDQTPAGECRADHTRGKVRVVLGLHVDLCVWQRASDQLGNLLGIHPVILTSSVRAGGAARYHPSMHAAQQLLATARRTLEIEAQALARLQQRLDHAFVRACELMLVCKGRVVVSGMGKSGHVAGKIAATLASTGTPAFFLHPAEAGHGDIGMITRGDLLLALSNSGETDELLTLLPQVERLGVPLIVITGRADSTLAQAAEVVLDASVEQEACPHNLAPTASTTAALALGDALAVALLEARGFTADDFARAHPGGTLGRQLLLRVADVMRSGDALPRVHPDTALATGLLEMSRKGLGMTAVVDGENHVVGVFTDGDLRRALDARIDVHAVDMSRVMTAGGLSLGPHELAARAARLMESHRVTSLLVVDDAKRLIGALNVHDLMRAGVV